MTLNVYSDCCDFCADGDNGKGACKVSINRCASAGLTNDDTCIGNCAKCTLFGRLEIMNAADLLRYRNAMPRDFKIPTAGLEARLKKKGKPTKGKYLPRNQSAIDYGGRT